MQALKGMLPICAWCKKIREDNGYWTQVESYISSHSAAEFTHCICPSCATTLDDGDVASSPKPMAWVLLLAAGLLEIVWAFTMKLSQGFTRPGASLVTLVTMLASFGLLSISMKTLPLGTAYTVWTGIGAVGAFIVGIVVLGEPLTTARGIAAVLIVSD